MARRKTGVAHASNLPVKAIWCGPMGSGTADASGGCFCDDEAGYVLKPNTPDNPSQSHNEWFCAHLGMAANIRTHGFRVVENMTGEEWFGSSWEKGEITDWWSLVLGGQIALDDIKADLSRIYALDLFTNNTDRHIRNYIVRAEGTGHRVWAIDHGRAWLFNGFPPPTLPLLSSSSTVAVKDWMKSNFGDFQCVDVIAEVLIKIKKIRVGRIKDIIASQPTNWLDQSQKDAIVAWWEDGSAHARLDQIVKGVGDGTLL